MEVNVDIIEFFMSWPQHFLLPIIGILIALLLSSLTYRLDRPMKVYFIVALIPLCSKIAEKQVTWSITTIVFLFSVSYTFLCLSRSSDYIISYINNNKTIYSSNWRLFYRSLLVRPMFYFHVVTNIILSLFLTGIKFDNGQWMHDGNTGDLMLISLACILIFNVHKISE